MYSLFILTNVDNYFTIGTAISLILLAINPRVFIEFLAISWSTSVTYSPNSFNKSPILFSFAKYDKISNFVSFIYDVSSALT